jgi:Flp pilus assembly protein TadB
MLENVRRLATRTSLEIRLLARRRALEERRFRKRDDAEMSRLQGVDRILRYSGIKSRFPKLSSEWWVAGNLAILSILFLVGIGFDGISFAITLCVVFVAVQYGILGMMRTANLKRVNEQLLKLLDFLGNYSITMGELTGVLEQVARYMDEPVRSALEACCLEARITGDVDGALLTMAEYVEHPKFKELARNMEISVRYCVDFSAMVGSSRRSMREYLKVLQERKGMMREAAIHMAILMAMSVVVLSIVASMIGQTFFTLLFQTLAGRIAGIVILGVVALFINQARKVQV